MSLRSDDCPVGWEHRRDKGPLDVTALLGSRAQSYLPRDGADNGPRVATVPLTLDTADRDVRQHVIHEASGGLGHAPAPAARAEAAPFAGERHEPLERALTAPHAGEAVRQHATGEEVPELLLHEQRQTGALGMVSRRVQECIQVHFDDAVQHAAFGVARLICGAWHARDIRPAHGRGQCRKRDTSKEWWARWERMLAPQTLAPRGVLDAL